MKKNRPVAVAWLLSYLAVLIILVTVNILTYMRCEYVLIEQVKENNENRLNDKSRLIDNVLLQANSIAYQNAVSSVVDNFGKYEKPFTRTQLYDMLKFREQWNKTYGNDIDGIRTAYIYLPKSDTVMPAGNMESKRYFASIYGGNEEEYQQWLRILTNADNKEIYTLQLNGEETKRIFYVMRSIGDVFDQTMPCTVVEINTEIFAKIDNGEKKSSFYVTDSLGNLIYGNNDENWQEYFSDDGNTRHGRSIANKIQSANTGITYIFVQNYTQYMKKVKSVRALMICSSLACIAFCLVLIKRFVAKNTEPLQNILKTLNVADVPKNTNEFQYISKAIKKAFDENKDYEDALYLQKKFFRGDLFVKILNDGDIDDNLMRTFEIKFENDMFIVALICVNKTEGLFFKDGKNGSDDMELALYSVENVIGELMNEKFPSYVFTYSGIIHCIINPSASSADAVKEVTEIVENVNRFSEENINTGIIAGISKIYNGSDNLCIAYKEAKELIEYRFVNPSKTIFKSDFENDKKPQQGYTYSLKTEQKVLSCVKSGDYSQAIKFLNDALEINSNVNYMSLPMVKCLVFDVLCTLIKISDEVGAADGGNGVDKISIYNRIMNCTSVVHVRDEVDKIIKQFSSFDGKKSIQKNNEFIAECAKKFVDDNYTNPEVTVAYVADKMSVTANYMSALFKDSYEIGLLDYISGLRVEYAKKLLRTTNISVDKISEAVGFGTTRTFSRTFVRIEGVTPGKYRLLKDE